MKIIEQGHVIEHITSDILQQIEKAGRNCWKSEDKTGCLLNSCAEYTRKLYTCEGKFIGSECNNCKHHSSLKFANMIIKKGHEAILEFGDIHVRLITNRGVLAELTRHRIGMSYAVESTRYVRYDGRMEFIRPVWCSENLLGLWDFDNPMSEAKAPAFHELYSPEWVFFENCYNAEKDYEYLIEHNWRPEQAREVLPNSLKTEIVVKGNIRAWRHMFQLRCSKKAHPQIRSLLTNLLIDLKEQIPVVFDDIGVKNG